MQLTESGERDMVLQYCRLQAVEEEARDEGGWRKGERERECTEAATAADTHAHRSR